MASLRILSLVYDGDKYWYKSPSLDQDVVLIEGYNGRGKSTFCNLIYYCLGGSVQEFRRDSNETHSEIVSDMNNFVELTVNIDGKIFKLLRFIGENEVTISEVDQRESSILGIFPVNRGPNSEKKTFSDWLLEKLGIPAVQLYLGSYNFILNVTDIFRLVYHDQSADPKPIYKKVDKGGFVVESELLRKVVFQVLLGKKFSEYYESVSKFKQLEAQKSVSKSLLDEYRSIVHHLRNGDIKNSIHIRDSIRENEIKLDKLYESRMAFKKKTADSSNFDGLLRSLQDDYINVELAKNDAIDRKIALLNERNDVSSLLSDAKSDVARINKIIYSHDQLNLFSPDTCPYCLNHVERPENHCICGHPVNESDYERFFYNTREYKEILSSKLKSIQTLEDAHASVTVDIREVDGFIDEKEGILASMRERIRELSDSDDEDLRYERVESVEDEIFDVKNKMGALEQELEIVIKYERLEGDLENLTLDLKEASRKVERAKLAAYSQISEMLRSFSSIYSSMIRKSISSITNAYIDDESYMPILNHGKYQEASSLVPRRLLYFIALLKLALEKKGTNFPKFLLIDTPESLGIEPDVLNSLFENISDIAANYNGFQVILTTGMHKYPDSLSDKVVLSMPKEHVGLLNIKQ